MNKFLKNKIIKVLMYIFGGIFFILFCWIIIPILFFKKKTITLTPEIHIIDIVNKYNIDNSEETHKRINNSIDDILENTERIKNEKNNK